MPTQPISNPTTRAATSIEASVSVTRPDRQLAISLISPLRLHVALPRLGVARVLSFAYMMLPIAAPEVPSNDLRKTMRAFRKGAFIHESARGSLLENRYPRSC